METDLPSVLFKEYPSIDNSKAKLRKINNDPIWIALEKIHGANLSFVTNGVKLTTCRRTGMLDDAETFFGWQQVRDKYGNGVLELFKDIKSKYENTATIAIYGELFGGIYQHPDVVDSGNQPIQRGVYYTPSIAFYAFDIRVDNNDNTSFWLNYKEAMKLFEKHEFFYAKPLFEGTLEDCLNFDIKINSTIPALLNLPPLEKNQIEGVVIKSFDNILIPGQKQRAIFKKKNPNFAEVNPEVGLTKYEQIRDAKLRAIEECYSHLERYITENRIHNLESKIGLLKSEMLPQASEMYFADVMKDFSADYEDLWKMVEEDTQERIKNNTASKARTAISDYYRTNYGTTNSQ